MKKIYLIALGLFTAVGFAQVKVGGTPTVNPNAMLEIEATNKGVLLPRVALVTTNDAAPLAAHVQGMTVYNTASTPAGNTAPARNRVEPGFYYNDGTKWNQMITTDNKAVKFFYMPSITFQTDVSATNLSKDLYAEYKAQFENPTTASTGAPTNGIPFFASPTDLYYYITDYDPAVFSNISINANGVMTYDVTAAATDCSLINIVFVVK
jgi:hypothetical protein